MANGQVPSGPAPALPGWLGAAVSITTQVGVPTVFALVLLWFVLTRLDTALKVIETQETARTGIVREIGNDFLAGLEKQTMRFEAAIQTNIQANREMMERYHNARDYNLNRGTPP